MTRGARRFGRRTATARTIAVQPASAKCAAMPHSPAATGRRMRRDAVHASCSPIL
ncbi:hypothetical protein BSLA_01r1655 [Burkholderia stabilis]|nr:hypothetical protein BSLA_01r1655 [Burkholderia stabilis]